MIDALLYQPSGAIQLLLRDDPKWNETRMSFIKGARSQDQNWLYVTNDVNPLGRHPFNVITEEIYK